MNAVTERPQDGKDLLRLISEIECIETMGDPRRTKARDQLLRKLTPWLEIMHVTRPS
ncbi:MAG TPA: hypothetical protein VGW38_07245 [Chloroflexota bacterium]|nr:hypothetical protein [Chloroflexota bacterium]